jgi:hypothetical protein
MKKLYKYLPPSGLFNKVFSKNAFVSLKASYPRDFNDPYELFLTIRTNGVNPSVLAYYQEILGTVPQEPTVCFSVRPDVVPMWAHYAHEFTGAVIECDEANIRKAFPDARIEDVKYSNTPIAIDVERLEYAYATAKMRHTFLLQDAAFNAAYFTKSKYWSYELERRLLIKRENVTVRGTLMIIQFPIDCVTAIITGPKMKSSIANKLAQFGEKAGFSCSRCTLGGVPCVHFLRTNETGASFLTGTSSCKQRIPVIPAMSRWEMTLRENATGVESATRTERKQRFATPCGD